AAALPVFAQDAKDKAKASIAMLNYLATESVIIEKSKENRLVLEEIRHKIENITNPSAVDETTQYYLRQLLQNITGMELTTLQSEKLRIKYENEKAQALSRALPNPLYLLSVTQTKNLKQAIATLVLMTIDSFISRQSAIKSADMNYLLGDLDLQGEDLKNLAEITGGYWDYMINISRQYNLNVSHSLQTFARETLDILCRSIPYLLRNEEFFKRAFLNGK
ncbi:MAG: hypothetical protein LBC77_05615, partial [Spirochaetaceae bacterium]|nr:hypothetical protein [Spirochaetaceae bacterium]